jgi:hypothetical protein
VNASEYDKCSTLTGKLANAIPAKGITGVNAYAHHVSRVDSVQVQVLHGFIAYNGITEGEGGRGG